MRTLRPFMFDTSMFIPAWNQSPAEKVESAQAALERHMESLPKIYGTMFRNNLGSGWDIGSIWDTTKLKDHTHSAVMFNLEEIEVKKCEHQSRKVRAVWPDLAECLDCGIQLKQKWVEVKGE